MARRRWENYGTPVHIEEIGRTPYNKLSKDRRNRRKCVFFRDGINACYKLRALCSGTTGCKYYKEDLSQLEEGIQSLKTTKKQSMFRKKIRKENKLYEKKLAEEEKKLSKYHNVHDCCTDKNKLSAIRVIKKKNGYKRKINWYTVDVISDDEFYKLKNSKKYDYKFMEACWTDNMELCRIGIMVLIKKKPQDKEHLYYTSVKMKNYFIKEISTQQNRERNIFFQ